MLLVQPCKLFYILGSSTVLTSLISRLTSQVSTGEVFICSKVERIKGGKRGSINDIYPLCSFIFNPINFGGSSAVTYAAWLVISVEPFFQ